MLLTSEIAVKTQISIKYFCVHKMSVVDGQKNAEMFYFRTNGEMPKMSPPLHYENIRAFCWTLYKSLIDFRIDCEDL